MILSFGFIHEVFAQQNPNLPNLPVNPAERQIERQIERIARQVERAERAPAEAVQQRAIEGVINASERASERAINGALVELPRAPLSSLPSRLSILNQQGIERFVEVEVEPGRRAIEREWILLVSSGDVPKLRQQATELWRYLTEEQELPSMQQSMLIFTVPRHLDNVTGISRLLPEDFHTALDRNYVYQTNTRTKSSSEDLATVSLNLPLASNLSEVCATAVRIGVIDTAIAYQHDAFQIATNENRLVRRNFLRTDVKQPNDHGTAVSSLFVGQNSEFSGLTPAATIFHAEVFYQQSAEHQGAALSSLLQALDWQIEQNVQVINLSLTGPSNRLLERALQAITAQNISVVAAAGNAGPFAAPQFPAAYPEVIAVTAIDRKAALYRWANQGEYIEFSALGVDVRTAQANSDWGVESGTSIATPIVSAFAACYQQSSHAETRSKLQQLAIDLGEQGRDHQYGHGLLHPVVLLD